MKKSIGLECPKCGYQWTTSYLKWIFKAQMHWIKWSEKRDYRYTRCPSCGKRSWIKHS